MKKIATSPAFYFHGVVLSEHVGAPGPALGELVTVPAPAAAFAVATAAAASGTYLANYFT